MDEPRNIVLILGNGFDLDLGLKTSYKDFWESEYCPKDYPAPLIKHLNQCWPRSLDAVKWYDLENEILQYAIRGNQSDVVSEEERKYILNNSDYDLCNKLRFLGTDMIYASLFEKGIIKQSNPHMLSATIQYRDDFHQSSICRDRKAFQHIKDNLRCYISKLSFPKNMSSTIAYQVLLFLDNTAKNGNIVSIYSFNYTPIPLFRLDPGCTQIHYMHGSCNDREIIIGTRDDQRLNEDYDFLQKSFDPAYNPPALVEDLKDADEVIIFGHSIGENDRQYFKAFFKQQTGYLHPRRKDIIIFTRDNESEIHIRRSLQKMTDWNLSTLCGQNNLQIIKTKNLVDDQKKLFDFLVKHGKGEMATREFIAKRLEQN